MASILGTCTGLFRFLRRSFTWWIRGLVFSIGVNVLNWIAMTQANIEIENEFTAQIIPA